MSAPTPPYSKADSGHHSTDQFPLVRNRNESGLLVANLDDAHRHRPHVAAPPSAFAACVFFAHPSRACSCTITVHNFCNWNDRFFMCRDRFAIDGFHIRLSKNAFLQVLQKSQTAHRTTPWKLNIGVLAAFAQGNWITGEGDFSPIMNRLAIS